MFKTVFTILFIKKILYTEYVDTNKNTETLFFNVRLKPFKLILLVAICLLSLMSLANIWVQNLL